MVLPYRFFTVILLYFTSLFFTAKKEQLRDAHYVCVNIYADAHYTNHSTCNTCNKLTVTAKIKMEGAQTNSQYIEFTNNRSKAC